MWRFLLCVVCKNLAATEFYCCFLFCGKAGWCSTALTINCILSMFVVHERRAGFISPPLVMFELLFNLHASSSSMAKNKLGSANFLICKTKHRLSAIAHLFLTSKFRNLVPIKRRERVNCQSNCSVFLSTDKS